ncbi:hypothetical protein EW026_g6716 [Hermanssonia centrifuga]|uniref:COP9 signalosome complex subunit 3 n=1 Tax=Hermanssonia centrifuga TaxID=98765 RepID=A0A4S4KBV7_9APHY|nr:hypothetical protein EW026_g6716 [Hermanssonia centrifuga]
MVQAAGENLKLILGPLRDLATRYPPTPSHLTTLHPIFLTACVTTRHFATALPILSSPIFNIDTSLSELSYNDNLIYHYAGGVAFGALKRWREAEEFLEICVTAPGQIPAAIQLEALKKLTLVQLILYGKATAPPKYTNPTLIRMLKNTSYHTLAKAYPQTISSLTATVYRDIDIFKAEQNLGLVQQVIQRAPRWLIRRLTLTYLTLGLGDIAKEVGIESEEEVRAVVVSMVESEDINASISVDGTVTFTTSTAQFSKAEIDKAVAQAQAQSQLLQELERTMNSSKEYLVKAIKHKDDAWGPDEDVMFNTHPGGSSWADENLYS